MSSANNPVPSSSREYSGPFKGSGFLCNVSVKSWPNLSSSFCLRLRIGKREDASVNIIQQREKEKDKSNDDDKNALDRKTDGQR